MSEQKVLCCLGSISEVEASFRRERDAVRRSHLQVIWRLLSGDPVDDVVRMSGYSRRWVNVLIDRWNRDGLAGLGDRRRDNDGAKPLLDTAGLVALAEALERAPADGGLWNGRKVAAWMSAYLDREVSTKRGFDYLHRLGYSLQQPRPRHDKAAGPEDCAVFKKNSTKQWKRRARRRTAGRSRCGPSTNTVSV